MIALESAARLLVVLHAAAAIVLIGAATHHGVVVRRLPWSARFNARLSRIYARVCAVAFLATTALGALAYPTYRYYVRGGYLDRHALWASRLFDVKEDLAVLGALAAVGAWILSSAVDAKSDRAQRTIYAALVWIVPAVVWFDVFSGLVITMVRSV